MKNRWWGAAPSENKVAPRPHYTPGFMPYLIRCLNFVLCLFNERSFESLHHNFEQTWINYKMDNPRHQSYGEKLRAVSSIAEIFQEAMLNGPCIMYSISIIGPTVHRTYDYNNIRLRIHIITMIRKTFLRRRMFSKTSNSSSAVHENGYKNFFIQPDTVFEFKIRCHFENLNLVNLNA